MIIKYSLGLDISSKDIKACICVIDDQQHVKVKSTRTFSNHKKGLDEMDQWINRWYCQDTVSLTVCMEATGVYHENCAYYLYEKGYSVSIVLPNKAKKYLQAIGIKSKNDTIDAKGLAQMGAEQNLEKWEPIGTFYYELRVLTRQYQSLKESLTVESNRLHAAMASARQISFEIKQIKKHIAFLEAQIAQLEKEIKRFINSNQDLKQKFDKVMKIHGISVISSATVIAETGGFLLFKNYKQVVSYAGYDVVENQSGNHVGKTRISKKGNSRIRRILHMPSLTAFSKQESVFGQLYQRVYDRTGIKMKAIVAVQKKLLVMIYYIWTKDIDYDIEYNGNTQAEYTMEPSLPRQEMKKAITSMASHDKQHRLEPVESSICNANL